MTPEQREQYKARILAAITPLVEKSDNGWIKSIDLGSVIKQDGIDYRGLRYLTQKRFLLDIFGNEIQIKGEKTTLEFRFQKETDNTASNEEKKDLKSASNFKYSNRNRYPTAPHIVRNLFRQLLKEPTSQSGWVKVRDLMLGVNWTGSVTDFSKTYGLQIKAPNIARISNISKYEMLDDIYFDSQKNSYPKNILALKEYALDEPWEDDKKDYGLLDNYICYTYARIKEEGKIALSEDELHGCWNTGLVDFRYLPIYCYMTRRSSSERWVFQGFCIDGEDLGKAMASHISSLPQRAVYFTNSNLLFEPESEKLTIDSDHIITEHPSRLPKDWLIRAIGESAEKLDSETITQYDERVGGLISEDSNALPYLHTLLRQAIDIALLRCQWNYKTAIPYYDPNSKNIGWFLPLCIRKDQKYDPFAALVVTKLPSGRYQGQTIYKLSWAYRCARLVCRPDSDWLSPSTSSSDEDNEDSN